MAKRDYSALWRVEGQRRSVYGAKGVVWSAIGEFRARSGDDAKRMARDYVKSSRDPDIAGAGWTWKMRAKRKRLSDGPQVA